MPLMSSDNPNEVFYTTKRPIKAQPKNLKPVKAPKPTGSKKK